MSDLAADTLLEEALEAWKDARGGVVAEVRNIPADRFDFRPEEEVRSVEELVIHIMEVSEMMVGELIRPDGSFRRKPFPELVEEYAGHIHRLSGKEDLLEALGATLEGGVSRLRRAGEIHMLGPIERFDGKRGTRLAWMHHGIAQEMYHRGQLCTYQRLMGRVPALTQRIQGGS